MVCGKYIEVFFATQQQPFIYFIIRGRPYTIYNIYIKENATIKKKLLGKMHMKICG